MKLAYSIQEAAEASGLSTTVIRRKINAGYIAAKYSGTKPVILATELESWLQSLPSEQPKK